MSAIVSPGARCAGKPIQEFLAVDRRQFPYLPPGEKRGKIPHSSLESFPIPLRSVISAPKEFLNRILHGHAILDPFQVLSQKAGSVQDRSPSALKKPLSSYGGRAKFRGNYLRFRPVTPGIFEDLPKTLVRSLLIGEMFALPAVSGAIGESPELFALDFYFGEGRDGSFWHLFYLPVAYPKNNIFMQGFAV
jgi:hypothetical protein